MDAFWNLGFVAVKPLEVLLTRDDVTLLDVLDDRNLFNECKEKNPKLIDYLSRADILRQLLDFALGDFADPEVNKPKFQHIATEVLCSEIDAFVDGCLANGGQLLLYFWQRGVKSPRGEGTSVLMLHFCKVFVSFLTRNPHEIFTFIQNQPDALNDILANLDMPQVADLLLKFLLLDREPTNEPVVDWLCDQHLMKQLLQKISPESDIGAHQSVLELIKNIILMSSFTPTPGRKEASVLSSNRLSRDLVSLSNSSQLITHLFPSKTPKISQVDTTPGPPTDNLPNDASISSFMNTASTVMELIRKNNSDYFEQYLFLRAREHLMEVQEKMQQEAKDGDSLDCRPALESAMEEIMAKCGLVNLGTLISAICDHLHVLQDRLRQPYSSFLPIPSTIGPIMPLTFERLRICELHGELLHYSNMLLPNRLAGTSPSYDEEGRLVGGLDALGDLAAAMMAEADPEIEEEEEEEEEQIEEEAFPISQHNRRRRSFASDSDSERGSLFNEEAKLESPSEESGSSNEATTRATGISPASSIENLRDRLSLTVPGSPGGRRQSFPMFPTGTPPIHNASKAGSVLGLPVEEAVVDDEDEEEPAEDKPLSPGDRLKTRFLELGILSTLVDLVFQFPWNNFLHSVVYDILHQVLFGKVEGTLNRELIISIFRDVKLAQRIVDAQQKNDSQTASEPRLGYMGHLTLMAVDIIGALEKYPDDLLSTLEPLLPQPAWDEYVIGPFAETQRVENIVLGGPRPQSFARGASSQTENGWGGDWNEEDDAISPVQEFRRGVSDSRQTADFGVANEEEDDGTFHFNPSHGFGVAGGWGSGSSSDSEDEHEAWIKNSDSAAALGHSRDAEDTGFDDAFADSFQPAGSESHRQLTQEEEDDGFGAFTNAEGDPVRFQTDFGNDDFDFGEFQSGDFEDPHEAERR